MRSKMSLFVCLFCWAQWRFSPGFPPSSTGIRSEEGGIMSGRDWNFPLQQQGEYSGGQDSGLGKGLEYFEEANLPAMGTFT